MNFQEYLEKQNKHKYKRGDKVRIIGENRSISKSGEINFTGKVGVIDGFFSGDGLHGYFIRDILTGKFFKPLDEDEGGVRIHFYDRDLELEDWLKVEKDWKKTKTPIIIE